MPFPPKKPTPAKPDDDETLKPAPDTDPDAPTDAPDALEDETEELAAEADKVGKAAETAGAPTKAKGGNSAPETPGQGVPDVKPHPEPGAKKEPEGDKQKLPKEADTAKAKEHPKGLPSLAVMTKAEAEKSAKDPMNNPHVQRLAMLVQSLAKIVQEHHAKLGAMPLPGQVSQNTQQQGNKALAAVKAVAKPMPGQPGVAGQGMRPGVTPTTPGPALTLEQINSIMTIAERSTQGLLSKQGAALLIARGFGMDEKAALAMVTPDAGAGPSEEPGVTPLSPEEGAEMISEEEEEMEGVEEEFEEEEEEEDEDGLDAQGRSQFAREYEDRDGVDLEGRSQFARQQGLFKKKDSADPVSLNTLIQSLEERYRAVSLQLDALEQLREDAWDEEDHPRDESGRFTSGGGGGGGGGGKDKDKAVPHVTVDPHWRSGKPAGDAKPERARPLDKAYRQEALRAEAEGNRAKAERLHALADAVKGERQVVKQRMRDEVKRAAEAFKNYPKEHPATPKQGADEYFKSNAHPANIERLKTAQPERISYLGGGVNGTHKIVMKDGSKATWKPKHGEAPNIRTNIPHGTQYIREAAASNLARVIGVQDLVPAVVAFHGQDQGYRSTTGVISDHGPFGPPKEGEDDAIGTSRGAGVKGSLHAWAPGTPISNMWSAPDLDRDAVERARVFDYITGNSDRHGGNMLVNERDGKYYPVLIDNGLAFNTSGTPDRVVFPYQTLGQNGLLESTKNMISKIDPNEVAKTLKASGLDRPAAKLVLQRLYHLKADPHWLDPKGSHSPHFVYDWSSPDKGRAESVLKSYEDLAEQTLRAHDGTRK